MRQNTISRTLLGLGAVAMAVSTAGCGHPATKAECEEIVERIAQLEIQKKKFLTDPEAIKTEIASTKQALNDSTMKNCVGKRITKGAMECVRSAKTADAIVNGCFD